MERETLDRYRRKLLAEQARLRGERDRRIEEIAETTGPRGESASVPTHPADQDAQRLDPQLAAAGVQIDKLRAVEVSFRKMQEGTYGVCDICNQPIGGERIDAMPWATLCKSCAEKEERSAP